MNNEIKVTYKKKFRTLIGILCLPIILCTLIGCGDGVSISDDGSQIFSVPYDLQGDYTIPDGIKSVAPGAFNSTGITKITIPNSVLNIGYVPFIGCSYLSEIVVLPGNQRYKSIDGVLFTADGKTLICFPPSKAALQYEIPSGVTTIERGAFAHCEYLTHLTIPESVTSVGDDIFWHCANNIEIEHPDHLEERLIQIIKQTEEEYKKQN